MQLTKALIQNGQLEETIQQPANESKNPLLNKNWSGYSGMASLNEVQAEKPELWSALNYLQHNKVNLFSHGLLNTHFKNEDFSFGTKALARIQFIEAFIYKTAHGKLFKNRKFKS